MLLAAIFQAPPHPARQRPPPATLVRDPRPPPWRTGRVVTIQSSSRRRPAPLSPPPPRCLGEAFGAGRASSSSYSTWPRHRPLIRCSAWPRTALMPREHHAPCLPRAPSRSSRLERLEAARPRPPRSGHVPEQLRGGARSRSRISDLQHELRVAWCTALRTVLCVVVVVRAAYSGTSAGSRSITFFCARHPASGSITSRNPRGHRGPHGPSGGRGPSPRGANPLPCGGPRASRYPAPFWERLPPRETKNRAFGTPRPWRDLAFACPHASSPAPVALTTTSWVGGVLCGKTANSPGAQLSSPRINCLGKLTDNVDQNRPPTPIFKNRGCRIHRATGFQSRRSTEQRFLLRCLTRRLISCSSPPPSPRGRCLGPALSAS